MKKWLSLILGLTLLLGASLPALAQESAPDIVGNWALIAATTAEGESYTADEVESVFGTTNYVLSLYSNGIAMEFMDGAMTTEPFAYEYDGEAVVLSLAPDNPLYPDPEYVHYMYMTANDGSEYTFSRQTTIEGMWGLAGAVGSDGTEFVGEALAEVLGVSSIIMVFNYNCSVDTYADGELQAGEASFSLDSEGNVSIYDAETDLNLAVQWLDDEHFFFNNGTTEMYFSKIYPVIGEWTLSFIVLPDGSFASNEDAEEIFGTTDVALIIESTGKANLYFNGESDDDPGTVSVASGGVVTVTGDNGSSSDFTFDSSGNMLGYEAGDGSVVIFTRSTPIVLPA